MHLRRVGLYAPEGRPCVDAVLLPAGNDVHMEMHHALLGRAACAVNTFTPS